MISNRGLIYDKIKDWARSKVDGAQMWYWVLVSVSKVRWPELSQLSLCSEFDKENSMEFSFNSLLLIHFTTVTMRLLSHGPHVTLVMWHTVTVTICHTIVTLWQSHVERDKRDIDCDKQIEKAVTVPNCVLKSSWGERGSGGIRKKLKSEYVAYLESNYRRNDGSSI